MQWLRRTPLGRLFGHETDALPVDLLRVAIGLLSLFYFFTLARDASDISGPDGLIDHALVQDIFWFTRIGLFHPGLSLLQLQGVFALGMLASVGVILGWRVRLCALYLFLVAASAFRWNLLVAYVDDAILHLLLFWLLLLPVGRTLTLAEAWRDPSSAWERWKQARVPGTAVGAFLLNLTLIYLVAGLWKWTSPMWRDGTALFAVLKLPVSYFPEFWQPYHVPWLRWVTWSALVLEPLIPLALLLRRGHPLKGALMIGMIGFHLGIIATLRIPFANFACLFSALLFLREELMAVLSRTSASNPAPAPAPTSVASAGWRGRFAVGFVIVLTLAMVRNVPVGAAVKPQQYNPTAMAIDPRSSGGLGAVHEWLYGALWLIGIAQEYQLFNWIDVRNYHAFYEVVEIDGDVRRPIDSRELFPRTTRSALLQCYLYDLCWLKIPPDRNAELKESFAQRFAQRYCRTHTPRGTVVVTATLTRITAAQPHEVVWGPEPLFRFTLREGRVVMNPPMPPRQVTANPSSHAATTGGDR